MEEADEVTNGNGEILLDNRGQFIQILHDEVMSLGVDRERAAMYITWVRDVGIRLILSTKKSLQYKERPHESEELVVVGLRDSEIERLDLPTHSDCLLTLWKQFANALSSVPSNVPGPIRLVFSHVQLRNTVTDVLLPSLKAAPIYSLVLTNNRLDSGGIQFVVNVLAANANLKSLGINCNPIESKHDTRSLIKAASCHPNLIFLHLTGCLGHCSDIIAEILPVFNSNVRAIDLKNNHMGSQAAALISSSLASDPRVGFLNLEDNLLNDFDAAMLADALRTNTTLWSLKLKGNPIQKEGINALYKATFNMRSMNALFDSNHTCVVTVDGDDLLPFNTSTSSKQNRKAKLQRALYRCYETGVSERNVVLDIGNLPIKLMPRVLFFIQEKVPVDAWIPISPNGRRSGSELMVSTSLFLFMREWSMPLLYAGLTLPEPQRQKLTRIEMKQGMLVAALFLLMCELSTPLVHLGAGSF